MKSNSLSYMDENIKSILKRVYGFHDPSGKTIKSDCRSFIVKGLSSLCSRRGNGSQKLIIPVEMIDYTRTESFEEKLHVRSKLAFVQKEFDGFTISSVGYFYCSRACWNDFCGEGFQFAQL